MLGAWEKEDREVLVGILTKDLGFKTLDLGKAPWKVSAR